MGSEIEDDVQYLKQKWVYLVCKMFRTNNYRVGKHFDATFKKFSEWLRSHPEVDVERYMQAQIQHMIDSGLISKLYPNVLLGQKAYQRYEAFLKKIFSPAEKERLEKAFSLQLASLRSVKQYLQVQDVRSTFVCDYSPIVIAFDMWESTGAISEDLRVQAALEIFYKPLYKQILPNLFLKEVEACERSL